MRRTRCLLALLLGLVPASLAAQQIGIAQTISVQDSGTACSVANTCATFGPVVQSPSVTFGVSGTFTGTFTPQVTPDGTNWFTVQATNLLDGTQTTGITATGVYTLANVGFLNVRLKGTTLGSGSANVTATRGLGGGGSGGGASAASTATAVWATALPGGAAAGTAGSLLGRVPDIAAGASGGLFIAGTNAPVTITGAGTALTLLSTSGNGFGLQATGQGTGGGIYAKAGLTGISSGIRAEGGQGGTGGDGFGGQGYGTGAGMALHGGAVGTNVISGVGAGLYATGDGTNGNAVTFEGGLIGSKAVVAIYGQAGNAEGIKIDGFGTYPGIRVTGGATNASGAQFTGTGTGAGISAAGGNTDTSAGILATSAATNGIGIEGLGTGTSVGIAGVNLSTGSGIEGLGGAQGILGTAISAGHGMTLTGVGTGKYGFNSTNGLGMGFSQTNMTTNTTTTIKSGSGLLHAIDVQVGATTTGLVTCYDNTAGSGTVLATITTTVATGYTEHVRDIPFATGLTCVTSAAAGAADLMFVWK